MKKGCFDIWIRGVTPEEARWILHALLDQARRLDDAQDDMGHFGAFLEQPATFLRSVAGVVDLRIDACQKSTP